MKITKTLESILNSIDERSVILDENGIVVFANTAYQKFIYIELGPEIFPLEGKKLKDLRPGAQLPNVLTSGKAIQHSIRREGNEMPYIVNGYPIFEDGKIIGAVSITTDMSDALALKKVLESYEEKAKQVYQRIKKTTSARYTFDGIVAEAPKSKQAKELAMRAASSEITVLLESESGAGKEVYAQSIHNASARKAELFIPVNCANFTESMLDSELFGYVEGAFTGAKKGGRIGLFEAASKGTLFLDEISEMPVSLQAKLLRALQEGRIRKIGDVQEIPIDVRVIAASNADLKRRVEEGTFRKDLYFRLNVFKITIPPLGERPEDIPYLTQTALQSISNKLKKKVGITDGALRSLILHRWPGNVRELFNVLEFTSVVAENGIITEDILPFHFEKADAFDRETLPLSVQVKNYEKMEIERLLKIYGTTMEGKKKAAEALGISIATLYKKLSN